MPLTPRTEQRPVQKLAMTPHLRRAIAMLSMDNATLTVSLGRKAAEIPNLAVRPPPSIRPDTDLPAASAGLEEHVMRQIGQTFQTDRDRQIAEVLLGELEPWGWLAHPPEVIARTSGYRLEDIETVLFRMQGFEPTGLFARTLSECLYLQAAEKGLLDRAMIKVLNNLPVLEADGMAGLAAACGCEVKEVSNRLVLLRGLDPKPGLQLDAPQPVWTRAPDLCAVRQKEGWKAVFNPDTLPQLAVLPGLDRIARRKAERLQKALERRNATVLAVASELIRRQTRYLDGDAPPSPLTLSVVAGATGRHSSTISRIASALTIKTPHGVTSLRDLLGTRIRGAGISDHDLTSRIERIVFGEDASRTVTDQQLSQLLLGEGVRINRRTVAKYRAAKGIPPSRQRRMAGQNGPGADGAQPFEKP